MLLARIEKCVQVGPDDYRMRPITKIFDESTVLAEVISWAKTHGVLINDTEITQLEVDL